MISDIPLLRVAVVGSGTGSNAKAIIQAASLEGASYDVCLVVSTRANAGICEVAEASCTPLAVIDPTGPDFGDELVAVLREQQIDLLALAGFNRLIPTSVLQALNGMVVNTHPALLPAFGGKGMYGIRVHEAVLAAGESVTGATVHWVTEYYDEGAVIEQSRINIKSGTTAIELEQEVKRLEHALYPRVLQVIGRMFVQSNQHSSVSLIARNL